MSHAILYYFSGTGNTKRAAEAIQETFEKQAVTCDLINMEDAKPKSIREALNASPIFIGLCFPVAIQSTFPLVWDFVESLPDGKGQKIFMVDTMDAFSGGVVGPMKKHLTEKGYQCVGAIELKMSNSMRTKEKSKISLEQKNEKALIRAQRFAQMVLDGKSHWERIPLLSDWMRSISKNRKIWTQTSGRISVEHERCIRCKLCLSACPVNAISMKDERIQIDHTRCISCMRCVNHCPTNAFLLDKKRVYQQKNGMPK